MPKITPIKILVYSHSPAINSGYSTLVRNIFKPLSQSKKYQIDIFGLKDSGTWHDPQNHPYHIHSAESFLDHDPLKRDAFLNVLHGAHPHLKPPWDIVFILHSPQQLIQPTGRHRGGMLESIRNLQKDLYMKSSPDQWFKTIGYYPIDGPLEPALINSCIGITDQPVVLSQYGFNQITGLQPGMAKPLKTILPGINLKDFHPLPKTKIDAFRNQYFRGQVDSDTFLITLVARNFYLSDIARSMWIFKSFLEKHPNSFLYLHTFDTGPFDNISRQAKDLGLEHLEQWSYPINLSDNYDQPVADLNLIYNASNVVLSTTQGTWWNLPLTEAMAAKTISLAPFISTIPEIYNLTDDQPIDDINQLNSSKIRGIPIKSGANPSEWITYGNADLNRPRPLSNVTDAVNKLTWVKNHPHPAQTIVSRAARWVKNLDHTQISKDWDQLIKQVYSRLQSERQHPDKTLAKIFKVQN